jgi:hypothetical protein
MRNLSSRTLRPHRMRELRSCYVGPIVRLVPSRQIRYQLRPPSEGMLFVPHIRGEMEV